MQGESSGVSGPGRRFRLALIAFAVLDVVLVSLALRWHHPRRAGKAATVQASTTRVPFRDPCIVIRMPVGGDAELPPGQPVEECRTVQQLPPDTSAEFLILHLNPGTLEDVRSEFPLPGSSLISFRRALMATYQGFPLAFGIGGSDNADTYLTTSDGMKHLLLRGPDSTEILARRPLYLPMLLLNKWVGDGAHPEETTLQWHAVPDHFGLQRADGSLESYVSSCTDEEFCLLQSIRDAKGAVTTMSRDPQRRIVTIASPGGAVFSFVYSGNSIARIADAGGHAITYTYSRAGRLAGVTYPDGGRTVFTWSRNGQLTSLGTSPGATQPVQQRMRAEYIDGRIASQTFSNDATYRFLYKQDPSGRRAVTIATPDGATYNLPLPSTPA